jgi:C-terminal processing protease CtpA/Prc
MMSAMARHALALAFSLALLCEAQNTSQSDLSKLAEILTFENSQEGDSLEGWLGGPPGTIFADARVFHSGKRSARIERHPDSPNEFSTMTKAIGMEFSGKSIEFRGFLRTEDVNGFAGLWMREDGPAGVLEFDNMQSRKLNGTSGWTEYAIQLPLNLKGRQLFFGVLLSGAGRVWADDLQLLVDGKPVWDAPKLERPKTAIDTDHEFDGGSGITVNELTAIEVDNLATLAKVWGFLKYHHPLITSGKRHWDYDLFRILPTILTARDRLTANKALLDWTAKLGDVPDCQKCVQLDSKAEDLYLRPDLNWLSDEKLLGGDLSRSLLAIYRNRVPGQQFFVSLVPGVGNPSFENEPIYAGNKFPDAGLRTLALFRLWNIIRYWYPDRDVIGEDWDLVLKQFLPRIATAKNVDSYQRELLAVIAQIHDTHANLRSASPVQPPGGSCKVPAAIRFLEGQAVVTGYSNSEADVLKIADVISAVNNVPVRKLVEDWSPYYSASNDPTRLRDIARSLTRGECTDVTLTVRRNGADVPVTVKRIPLARTNLAMEMHDVPGDAFRLFSDNVAYLKLSSVKANDAARYIQDAAKTKGLIIDIRNYPSQFVVFALGELLVNKETQFVRFTIGDLSNPGAFHWTEPATLKPRTPHYAGKVVILVDETSVSQAEYTAMAFRSAPGAVVVGSTTAGADGNVSAIPLPGGYQTFISGIGVFYPDKRPTQRVGIVPDVTITPTRAGIRAGRDEVLEQAIREILGPDASAAEIEKMGRH